MSKEINKIQILFDKLVQILIGFLPWSTVLSVFLTYKIHIPGANFLKEIIFIGAVMLLGVLYFQEFQKTKKNPIYIPWPIWVIFAYFMVMIAVTIFTTGVKWLVFGGRYDFIFLIIFLFAYYSKNFLIKPISHYIKIFLVSSGIMLLVSGLLKFPLDEELLMYLGYSGNPSAWQFGDAPPIFHGIEGAGVRRFQGLLDGPNSMGAFLILFSGLFLYYIRKLKDWYFVAGIGIMILVLMLIYTYSRSALLGYIFGAIIALLGGFGYLYREYKKQMIAMVGIVLLVIGAIFLKYNGNTDSIIGREWSTKWHSERMLVGIKRFISSPMGQGMGSAGPAYRHVLSLQDKWRDAVEEEDRFYIPESWYIQQFIEWGFIGGVLFIVISAIIFFSLFSIHSLLAGTFAGIAAMNFFLHTYESSVISWLLFFFMGLFFAIKFQQKSEKNWLVFKNVIPYKK